MKMIHSLTPLAEVQSTIAEIRQICDQYNFWDRECSPYPCIKMTVRELVESDGWNDYEHYTSSSKYIIRKEINGLADTLEHWVAYQNEPDVKIHYLEGKKKGLTESVKQSLAEMFIEVGAAELA